jgi:hypothetical protein
MHWIAIDQTQIYEAVSSQYVPDSVRIFLLTPTTSIFLQQASRPTYARIELVLINPI